jgi:hypothetical protein
VRMLFQLSSQGTGGSVVYSRGRRAMACYWLDIVVLIDCSETTL